MTWPCYLRNSIKVDGVEVKLTPKVCDLAFLLLVRRDSFVPLPEIIEFLWPDPDSEPDFSEDVIRTYATRLRRALPDGYNVVARATFCTDLMEPGHYHPGALMLEGIDAEEVEEEAPPPVFTLQPKPKRKLAFRRRVRLGALERQRCSRTETFLASSL